MKVSTKALLLTILSAGLAAALSLLALWLSGGGSTHAQGPIVLAIDMDPTGNSCPGDGVTDCTVGTIDVCQQAMPGSTFSIDAVVMGLSNGHSGWSSNFSFPDINTPASLTLTGEVLQNPTVNLIMQSIGSVPNMTGGGVPDATSPHGIAMADFGTAEATPPFTQGVLARLTFQVAPFAVPGLYSGANGFSFVPGTYQVFDRFASPYPQVAVLDGSAGCGMLAIAPVACPIGPCMPYPSGPAGGIAELPDVAGSPGVPYGATAGLAAAALALTTAWYARRRRAR